jgi:protein-tyrosine phosphatase
MGQQGAKGVLFLCTGNYYRSRFAEILFNSVAAKMGLPWKASSGGLALERGVNNVGPMAVAAVRALEALGVRAAEDCARMPAQVTAEDLGRVDWIVALSDEEHRPLLLERFPAYAEKAEYWQVADAPEALPLIEREVMDLVARLMGGGRRRKPRPPEDTAENVCPTCRQPTGRCTCRTKAEPTRRKVTVRVGRETKGRRGKGVTTVSDLPFSEPEILALAARLKERCGTGGTVKDGRIEIQGDQRDEPGGRIDPRPVASATTPPTVAQVVSRSPSPETVAHRASSCLHQ